MSDIGAVVTATDADGDTLEYTLEGTGSSKFTIDSATGQIKTKVGEKYSYEDASNYFMTVKADDTNGGTDTVVVNLAVSDLDEAPVAPAAPSVSATSGSTTSLDVSWSAPDNTGRPAIANYDLRYRQGNFGSWTNGPQDETGTSASIGSLTAGTSHQVQVRAWNDEGDSPWSSAGSGSTNDLPVPVLSVSPATALEGEALEFAVTLSSASADAVTVAYAATGVTATAGTDFTAPGSGAMLTIPAGDTAATITIETLTDAVDEDAETLTLTLSAPQNATLGTATATGTIDEMVVDVGTVIYMLIEPDPDSVTALIVKWRSVYLDSARVTDYDIQYAEERSGWPYRVDGEDWLTVAYARWVNGMTWQGWSGTIESLAESESERGSLHYRARLAGVTEGQAYRIRIRARTAEGPGPWSFARLGGAGARPSPPDAPKVLKRSWHYVRLAWCTPAPGSGAIRDYDMRYRELGEPWTDYPAVDAEDADGRNLRGNLRALEDYEVQVRVTTAVGTSDWSASKNFTTLAQGAATLEGPDTAGCSSQAAALEPLTVALEDLPEGHDGSSAFTVRLAFSDEVALDEAGLRAALLVSNGSVTGVSSVSADLWDITITPAGNATVQLLLSPTSDCAATGAICTDDGRMLSAGLGASVPFVPQTAQQQTVAPLTASFSAVPAGA